MRECLYKIVILLALGVGVNSCGFLLKQSREFLCHNCLRNYYLELIEECYSRLTRLNMFQLLCASYIERSRLTSLAR